ncbi:signal peptide peptidase-domain-containing protein [Daldinia sp. FL1419]|nr:signal peptide peptidase-domain-containing protein [Daldinia sp. FL1419]
MASENSTVLAAGEIAAAKVGESLAANETLTEKLATLPGILWSNRDFFLLEGRIIFTAIACIYIGSQAALHRPPSANPAKGKKDQKSRDEDRERELVQGLLPSDAIILPIMAGMVLIGLYYLIKWLDDTEILNKILKVYFSFISVAAMWKLITDSLHCVTGFIFPTVWLGKNSTLYHIDPLKRGQWFVNGDSAEKIWDDKKKTPLPHRLSELDVSDNTNSLLWGIRRLLTEYWTVRLSIYGITNQKLKIRFHDIIGSVLAVLASAVYYVTESNFISNFMGYSFSYAGIIVLSPTTFATGSAVLLGLFFYDIYMVFYTPYMVTVATKLDVPIKLVFEGPTKASMLGLGDIVVPGIFVGLCLRFDLYMYYYRQRRFVPVELKSEDVTSQIVTKTETQRMVVKPDYVSPQGQWGDWFWSTKFGKLTKDATPALEAAAFPKPYFHAALVGYLLAMVVTLVVLLVYRHAQPALLYLVPGIVFAAWTTGLFRGELREMWGYTEDGSLDTVDTIVEVDGDGNIIGLVQKKDDSKSDNKEDSKGDDKVDANSSNKIDKNDGTEANKGDKLRKEENGSYSILLFSIEVPAPSETSDP